MIVLMPTALRINEWYIRIYILWMNFVLQIIGPFILLIVLNVLTYKKILDFERTLSDTLRIREATTFHIICWLSSSWLYIYIFICSE